MSNYRSDEEKYKVTLNYVTEPESKENSIRSSTQANRMMMPVD